MNRPQIQFSILGVCLAICFHECCTAKSPPNVVLILSDDQAWTDYSFMGHPVIQTPHLDQLAARSATFRRGYTPTPLCRPSLMTMITGLYPHQHGVTGNDPKPDKSLTNAQYAAQREQLIACVDRLPTIPKLLGEHGYLSMQSGKWWEGNYSRGGFTHGMTRGFPNPGGRHGDDGLQIGRKGMQPVFDFITESKLANKPFFLWYAPFLPHTPHDPPDRLLTKYRSDGRPIELAKYYAMCELFDETCGQLLDHLDEQKLNDNTLVIYVTDNGWIQATPEMNLGKEWGHGFAPRSKQTPYEGGIRTPIMVSWPGRIAPKEYPDLCSTLDIMPTVLAATGLQPITALPGRNLLPLVEETKPLDRTYLCGESYSHDIADLDHHETSLQYRWCIEGRWKLILSYDCPPDRYSFVHAANERTPQLFDIESDPHEKQNLAGEHPEVVGKLAANMQETWHVKKTAIGLP
jgi:arylsulfatase A-like enzyme